MTGAKEAHLIRVINNLTNIAIGTDKAKEQIEGSNFASETSNLTVAQILSESATAMVTQATNNSKHLLQIINKK